MIDALLRSALFLPATRLERVPKAIASGADAVIVDLEDAVAVTEKTRARAALATTPTLARAARRVPLIVRINALGSPFAFDDVAAAVGIGVDAILVPKVEDAGDLRCAALLLAHWERAAGRAEDDATEIVPIVETARGLTNVDAIARGERVRRLSFGAGDLALDTASAWAEANPLLNHARALVRVASRSAGLEPPLDTVYPHLDDEAGLRREAELGRTMGFGGKLAIHPKQIGPIHAVYTPTAAECAQAERVIEAFTAAERRGSAAFVLDGAFVDYPIVHRARAVLATAQRLRSDPREHTV